MNFDELLEYLDLEDGRDFEYFEAMADMIESEDYIEPEAMYQLFDRADKTMIEELLNDYFEDILEGLPEDSGEIFSLLHQIKLSLTGMISNMEDDTDLRSSINSATGIPVNRKYSLNRKMEELFCTIR